MCFLTFFPTKDVVHFIASVLVNDIWLFSLELAHKQDIAKHQQGPSQKWGNFYYFGMQNISDIYFIGGFGTVAWVDVKEYGAIMPDMIAVDGGEQNLNVRCKICVAGL